VYIIRKRGEKAMPDITMCRDKECPHKDRCYRFLAEPNKLYQSFFCATPREDSQCIYFGSIYAEEKKQEKKQ
jgi:hypothetical protein